MPHDLGTHHLDQLIPQTASESGPTALGIVGPRVELPIRFIRVARNEIRSVHRLRRELHYQTTSRDRSNTWTMPNSTGCSRPLLSYGPTELSSMRDRWFESSLSSGESCKPSVPQRVVGQRRSESPLLLQAHRLTLASPAAGPELKHAGERRSAIHATPVLAKTPAG